MSTGIFSSNAPHYWDLQLRIVPVEPQTKRPATDLKSWQAYLAAVPNEQKRQEWLTRYAEYGIGLLLGHEIEPDSYLVGIDVDDDRLVRLVLSLLGLDQPGNGTVLAGKRGSKGSTIFGLAPKTLRSTVIKGAGGLGNIDFLAGGRMTVLPPSIHPDTLRPYEVLGKSLLDASLDELPRITAHEIGLLKVTLASEHALTLISGEGTHDAGIALTAALMRSRATDEEIFAIFAGLLPENYRGNSLTELPGWIESARAKGFDSGGPKSTSAVAMLISLALEHCSELFNDGDGNAYASFGNEGNGIAHKITSTTFRSRLRHLNYASTGKSVGNLPLNEAISTIESIALFKGPTREVNIRVAGSNHSIEIDLGRSDGSVIHIDKDGWRVEPFASNRFTRAAGFRLLPNPTEGGTLKSLQKLLNLDQGNFLLLVCFLVNALKPNGPYFILLVEGEQGSGKSFFCEVIKRIVDPNKALRLRLPDTDQNLMIQAKEYRLLNYDNASGMKADMSDALCSLATGGGIAVRRLYTDGELHVMSYARPFVINGISGYANRPDLMERAIPIKLPPLPEEARKTEAEMLAALEEILPAVLGALYKAASFGLRNFADVESPRLRMADAARWIRAAEGGVDVEPGELVAAITTAQNDFIVDRVQDDPLFIKLRGLTKLKPFEGYVGDLFGTFELHEKSLPQSPSRLSNQLDRLRPAMTKAGVHVEFLGKDRRGRKIRITSELGERRPPKF